MAPLSINRIISMVNENRQERAAYVAHATIWEGMYNGRQFEKTARQAVEQDGREQIVMPTAFNTVHLGLRLINSIPKIGVPSCHASDDSDEYAMKRQKWLGAMYQRVNAQQQSDVLEALKWYAFVRGRHVVSIRWIGDVIPEAVRKNKFPILIQPIDPFNAGVIRGPYQTDFAYIYEENVPRWKLRQQFPKLKFGEQRMRRLDDVEEEIKETVIDAWWVDHETGKIWNAVLAGSEFAKKPVETKYREIPIIEGMGDTTYSQSEELRGLSILYPMEGTWEYQNRLVSQMATGMLWYFWPHIKVSNETGAALPADSVIRPGETTVYPWGTTIEMVQMNPNVPLAQQLLQQLETVQQQSTFPGVMYGEAGSMQAGYGVNLLTQSAAGRTLSFRRNLELTCESINRIALSLVEEFGGKAGVTAWGNDDADGLYEIALTKKEIEGYYENSVKLASETFADEMQKVAVLIQMTQAGLISSETFRTLAPFNIPTDEDKRVEVESALKSESMQQKVFAATLIAYYPDTWNMLVKGTPLEQVATEIADMMRQIPKDEYDSVRQNYPAAPPPPTPPMGMPPGMPPPGMMGGGGMIGAGGPPPGMMGGEGGMMGATPPGQAPGFGEGAPGMGGPPPMPAQGGAPLQPPGIPGPMGGGIPPEMQGQLTPETLGMMGVPPEMWERIMGDPQTQQALLQQMAQGGM